MLASYSQADGHSVEAEKKPKETPPLLKTPVSYVQPSPWLAIANKNVELMRRFASELGLWHVSRSRVNSRPLVHRRPADGGRRSVHAAPLCCSGRQGAPSDLRAHKALRNTYLRGTFTLHRGRSGKADSV